MLVKKKSFKMVISFERNLIYRYPFSFFFFIIPLQYMCCWKSFASYWLSLMARLTCQLQIGARQGSEGISNVFVFCAATFSNKIYQ